MKQRNATKFFFFLFLGASFLLTAAAQPKLSVDRSNIDLGVIYNGVVKKAKIVLKNVGKDTLRINGVQTSCGCTTVKQPKSALGPGESDAIEVEFNSTGFRGKITKHVSIRTNDESASNASVALVGDVVEELAPIQSASALWLGSLPTGKEAIHKFGFKNVSGKTIALKGYKSSSPKIIVTLDQKSVLPSDTIYVTIKVTPDRTDYSNEQILFETDSNKQTQVPLRVSFIGVKPN